MDLSPARSFGASCAIPLFGGLTSTDRTATLQDPFPERSWINEVDTERQTVAFQAQASDLRLELPMEKMLGTVGVAPPAGEVRSSLVPDTFGGNIDTPEMRAGATCYLAVNVGGGLFSVGDGHYRQGEGEACGTAVEGAMDVTIVVELITAASASVRTPGSSAGSVTFAANAPPPAAATPGRSAAGSKLTLKSSASAAAPLGCTASADILGAFQPRLL